VSGNYEDWLAEAVRDLEALADAYPALRKMSLAKLPASGTVQGGRLSHATAPLPIDPRPIDLRRAISEWAARWSPLVRGNLHMGLEPVTPTASKLAFLAGVFPQLDETDPDEAELVLGEARRLLWRWRAISQPEMVEDRDDRWEYARRCPECETGRLIGHRHDYHVECDHCRAVWDMEHLLRVVDTSVLVGLDSIAFSE